MLENREASLGMRPAKRGESDNVTTTLCQNRTVPGRRETASPGLEPATGAGTPGRAQGAHSAARHPALDASPQTTQTTPNGQCFSASVLQCFSASVFQYFSISAFQHFSISAFCFLLSAFQVSGLKSHPSSFPLSDGPIVHGLWSLVHGLFSSDSRIVLWSYGPLSMVYGLMTQHFSISAFQHFSV